MGLTALDFVVLAVYILAVVWMSVYFLKQNNVPFDPYYTGIVSNVVMLLVGFLTALLLPAKSDRSLEGLTVWGLPKYGDAPAALEAVS